MNFNRKRVNGDTWYTYNFDDSDHFFNMAVLQGWEGNEGDMETDVSKAILLQHDRDISSIFISKLGKWQSLALTYPISTIGRSCFLLRTLYTKLQPPSTSGLSAGILWGLLDQLLTLEQPPSRINMEIWVSKIDLPRKGVSLGYVGRN